MTPEQAQSLLDGTTPVPWALNPHGNIFASVTGEPVDMEGKYDPGKAMPIIQLHSYLIDEEVTRANQELLTAAPALARTVADLTEEWTVEVPFGGEVGTFDVNDPDGLPVTEARARIMLANIQQTHPGARLYRRYVSPTEAIE